MLDELDIQFTVLPKNIDEDFDPKLSPQKVAECLSEKKALAFSMKELDENVLIISADTIVTVDDQILGKPANPLEAKEMLKQLSGRKHEVITGVTIRTRERLCSFSALTKVYFKTLTDEEMSYYIQHFRPFDKAGAYGIQEWIGHVAIERIEGSYFNVMGLPTHMLYEELLNFV